MRLGLATALWQRPRLAGIVLRYWARLAVPGVELVRVAAACASDPDPVDVGDLGGWEVIASPNDGDLSRRFNDAVAACRGCDAVMIIGSDDLACAGYVEACCEAVRAGARVVTPQQLYLYDLASSRLVYVRARIVGAGRVLARTLLDDVAWRPYEDGYPNAIEAAMSRRLKPGDAAPSWHPLSDLRDAGRWLVDVKGMRSMTPFKRIVGTLGGSDVVGGLRALGLPLDTERDLLRLQREVGHA